MPYKHESTDAASKIATHSTNPPAQGRDAPSELVPHQWQRSSYAVDLERETSFVRIEGDTDWVACGWARGGGWVGGWVGVRGNSGPLHLKNIYHCDDVSSHAKYLDLNVVGSEDQTLVPESLEHQKSSLKVLQREREIHITFGVMLLTQRDIRGGSSGGDPGA